MSRLRTTAGLRSLRRGLVAAALVVGPAVVVVAQAQPAGAATFTVDTTADGAPQSTDCTTPVAGSCSLRDAVAAASASAGPHTISLAAGATYQLSYCDATTGRALRVNVGGSSLTIEGNGATIEQTCPQSLDNGEIIMVNDGAITVRDVTLTGADSTDGVGGIQAGNDNASVTADHVTITGNSASFQPGIGTAGALTVIDSTIAGNTSTAPNDPAVSTFNDTMLIVNSTIADNVGGGIHSGVAGGATLVYSTISGNSAATDANVDVPAARFTSFGSVVTDPQGGGVNCGSAGTSDGYNYESGGDTCGFSAATDVADGASPQLGALADNGGPTQTELPAPTSPLLDRIPAANCQDAPAAGVTTDQRGITRPQGTGCDVGAVEVEVVPVTPVTPVTPATPITIAPSFTG